MKDYGCPLVLYSSLCLPWQNRLKAYRWLPGQVFGRLEDSLGNSVYDSLRQTLHGALQ